MYQNEAGIGSGRRAWRTSQRTSMECIGGAENFRNNLRCLLLAVVVVMRTCYPGTMNKGAVVILLLGAIVTRAFAGTDEVRAWFENELRLAAEPVIVENYLITIDQKFLPSIVLSELNELKHRVSNRPDHPDRALYETESRRNDTGGDVVHIICAIPDEVGFRLSTENTWDGTKVDTGLDSSGSAWSFNPIQLNIVESAKAPIEKDYAAARNQIEYDLGGFFYGGVRFLPYGSVEITSVLPIGDADSDYQVLLRNQSQDWEAEAVFRWDSALERGFVKSVRYTASPLMPDLVGSGFETRDWKFNDLLGRWVAGELTMQMFKLRSVLTIKQVEFQTKEELRSLVAVPDPLGTDPIRGKMTAVALYDHRPAEQRITYYNDDRDTVGTTPLDASGGAAMIWTGRVVLLGLLTVFVGVYMYKKERVK